MYVVSGRNLEPILVLILAENCDQRSAVYVRHRTLNTAAAPGSFHLIPDPHSRCFHEHLARGFRQFRCPWGSSLPPAGRSFIRLALL